MTIRHVACLAGFILVWHFPAFAKWTAIPPDGLDIPPDEEVAAVRYRAATGAEEAPSFVFYKRRYPFGDVMPWKSLINLSGNGAIFFRQHVIEILSDAPLHGFTSTLIDAPDEGTPMAATVEIHFGKGVVRETVEGKPREYRIARQRFEGVRRISFLADPGESEDVHVLTVPRTGQARPAFWAVSESGETKPLFHVSTATIFPFEVERPQDAGIAAGLYQSFLESFRQRFPKTTLMERKQLSYVDLERLFVSGELTGAELYVHGFVHRDGSLSVYAAHTPTGRRRLWNLEASASPAAVFESIVATDTARASAPPPSPGAPVFAVAPFFSTVRTSQASSLAKLCEDLMDVHLSAGGIAVDRRHLAMIAREMRYAGSAPEPEPAGWLVAGWVSNVEERTLTLGIRLIRMPSGEIVHEQTLICRRAQMSEDVEAAVNVLFEKAAIAPAGASGVSLSLTGRAEALEQYLFALNYLDDLKLDDAEMALRAALAVDSDFGLARYRLFLLEADLGRVDDATQTFKTLSERFPYYPQLADALIVAAEDLYEATPSGNARGVAELLAVFEDKKMRESAWMPLGLIVRGKLLEKTGDIKGAYAAYTKVNLTPKDFKWFYNRFENGLEAYASHEAARLRAKAGVGGATVLPIEKTLEAVKRAAQENPKLFQAWYQIGRLSNRRLGQAEQAKAAFRKALELRPDYAEAWKELWLIDQTGDGLSRALKLNPRSPTYQFDLGRYEEALKSRQSAHDFISSLAADNLFLMDRAEYAKTKAPATKDRVIERLQTLLTLQPYRSKYRREAADFFRDIRRRKAAMVHYRFIVENDPAAAESRDAMEQARNLMADEKRMDGYVKWSRFVHDGNRRMAQGEAMMEAGKCEPAAEQFRWVLTEDPESLLARHALIQWIAASRCSPSVREDLAAFVRANMPKIVNNPYWKEDAGRLKALLISIVGRDEAVMNLGHSTDYDVAVRLESGLSSDNFSGDAPVFSIRRVRASPRLDGRIDENEWKGHDIPVKWMRFEPYPPCPDRPTRFYATYDDTRVYFAFHCVELPGHPVQAYQTDTGSPIYFEDGVMIQLDPARTMQGYMEIRFNALGLIRTSKRGPFWDYTGVVWDPVVEHKCGRRPDGWDIEFALEAAPGSPKPSPGAVWRVNPARVWHDADVVIIAPTRSNPVVSDPENFAMFKFE